MTREPEMLEGWRHLELFGAWNRNGELVDVWYQSLNQPDRWRGEEEAVCRRDPFGHQAPQPGCRCGWYALKKAERVRRGDYDGYGWRRRNGALAKVRLWGTVQEGRGGYRAQYQRVESLEVERMCVRCGGDAEGLGIVVNTLHSHLYTVRDSTITGPLEPLCAECATGLCRWENCGEKFEVRVTPGEPYIDTQPADYQDDPNSHTKTRLVNQLVTWLIVGGLFAAVYAFGERLVSRLIEILAW